MVFSFLIEERKIITFFILHFIFPPFLLSARDENLRLSVIKYPNSTLPAIVKRGENFDIELFSEEDKECCWEVTLIDEFTTVPLDVVKKEYNLQNKILTLSASVPSSAMESFYKLRINSDGYNDTNENAVKVISEYPPSFYFIHISDNHLDKGDCDSHTFTKQLKLFIKHFNVINPEFVIFTGDNTACWGDGCEGAYKCLVKTLQELQVPAFLVPGNHDWDAKIENYYDFQGYKRYFSFEYSNLNFIGLDTGKQWNECCETMYLKESDPLQFEWLFNQLKAENKNSILFFHFVFKELEDIFGKYPVIMTLYGHTHINSCFYGGGCWQINTASGAYIEGNKYFNSGGQFRLIRIEDNKVKSFAIEGTNCGTISLRAGGELEEKIKVEYSPANDGSAGQMKATITNLINERFENGKLRFNLKAGINKLFIHNGTLIRQVDTSTATVVFVKVNISPLTTTEVEINDNPLDFLVPNDGDLIGEKVKIVPLFNQGFNPIEVEFYFNKNMYFVDTSEPFEYEMDTSAFGNGEYEIKVSAKNEKGEKYQAKIKVRKFIISIQPNRWEMIVLPWLPDSENVVDVLGNSNVDVFRFVGNWIEGNKYCPISENCFGSLKEVGKGFWLFNRDVSVLNIEPKGEIYYKDYYKIPLEQGWNQIGSPFIVEIPQEKIKIEYIDEIVSLEEAVELGWIDSKLYKFSDNGYEPISVNSLILEPHKSYWFKALNEMLFLWIYK